MHSRWIPAAVVLVTAVAAAVAVAMSPDDSGTPVVPTGGGARSEDALPPDAFEELAAIFDPELEEMGLRLARGRLQDPPGTGDASVAGRHLAVYVEPLTRDHTGSEYERTFVESARVFLPSVFERWPGLVSMDVCQEPPPGVDDRPAPPPVTVLEVPRDAVDAVDWRRTDIDELVAASDAGVIRVVLGDENVQAVSY